jgi:NADH-quinone oxidoreductase subunit C
MSSPDKTPMADRLEQLADALAQHFGDEGFELLKGHGELTLVVPADRWLESARTLRDHEDFGFEELVDLCGVDYGTYGQTEWETQTATETGFSRGVENAAGPRSTRRGALDAQADPRRFAVVCHLLSLNRNLRLRVRVFCGAPTPMVDSLVGVWTSANWFEREAFDLFGILFNGHPDLRRILTDYGFIGHPFRKDFPLVGEVEMRYDPERQRVVYEPVQIEPRVLVPRVVRDDNRYTRPDAAGSEASDA